MKILLDHNSHIFLLTHEGRKFAYGVKLHRGLVKKVRVERSELQYFRPAQFQGKPYPETRARRKMREIGKTLGITKGAAVALRK